MPGFLAYRANRGAADEHRERGPSTDRANLASCDLDVGMAVSSYGGAYVVVDLAVCSSWEPVHCDSRRGADQHSPQGVSPTPARPRDRALLVGRPDHQCRLKRAIRFPTVDAVDVPDLRAIEPFSTFVHNAGLDPDRETARISA